MSTHKKFLLGSGAALAAVALAASGTVATYASAPVSYAVSTTASSTSAAAPNPYAQHVGMVVGLQTGPGISADNAESVHAFKVLHQNIAAAQNGTTSPSTPPHYLHNWLGTSFNDTPSMIGSQADQSVSDSIYVNEHFTTLYTPTMYPTGGQGGANGSCIEMSTMYHRNKNIVAAWDWCSAITFVAQVKINAAFMKTYTKNGSYTDQIVQTDKSTNTWTSYLYNYQTDKWNQFYQQSGTSQTGTGAGWDFYEIYSSWREDGTAFSCKDLHGYTVSANNIMEDIDGTWTLADPTNAGHIYDSPLSDFRCPEIAYQIITPYSHWKVQG